MKFDSAYYDGGVYDAINNSFVQDIGFYTSALDGAPKRVLELACGTGRVTIPLILAGHKVTAVDIAAPMLKGLREKLAAQNLEAEAIVEADIATYVPSGEFDAILIPYKALQHAHSRSAVEHLFKAVHVHLRPGGLFIFDIFNPSIELLARSGKDFVPSTRYRDEQGSPIVVYERNTYDSATQVSSIEWSHRTADGTEIGSSWLHMRMFFPQELRMLLTVFGFKVKRDLGNYDGEEFSSRSQHQILICAR